MNRKKWALLTALLIATAAPLPTNTPSALQPIPAALAKKYIEAADTHDTDGDPDTFGEGKPQLHPRLGPGNTQGTDTTSLQSSSRLGIIEAIRHFLLFLIARVPR